MHRMALVVLSLIPLPVPADGLYSRNLDCEKQTSTRSVEVCGALENALEWSWTGHAIISPSFRMDTERLRLVYCNLPIVKEDTPLLVDMALDSENSDEMVKIQIYDGVLGLLSFLGPGALEQFPVLTEIEDKTRRNAARYLRDHIVLTISESSTSIFSPFHPQYILRAGCE